VASIYAGPGGFLARIKVERVSEFLADVLSRLHAEHEDLLHRIGDTGQLPDEDEETLGKAIKEMIDDFGPDYDAEGHPLEEGESDRIKDEGEREAPGRTDGENGSEEAGSDSGETGEAAAEEGAPPAERAQERGARDAAK